jgi:hypothetical protein
MLFFDKIFNASVNDNFYEEYKRFASSTILV